MSVSESDVPSNCLKIPCISSNPIAYQLPDGRYNIITNDVLFCYLLCLLQQEQQKNKTQQTFIQDLLARITALENK